MKKLIAILVVLWGGAAFGWWYFQDRGDNHPSYRTVKTRRGDLQATISATGTLEPEEVVDVGAQVGGAIESLNVNFGSLVEKDTVLAQLDDALFKARVSQAKANLSHSEAELIQAKAKLNQAQIDLERLRQLRAKGGGMVTAQEFDTAQANHEVAKATVAMVDSSIDISKANLEEATVNLGYTTIRSPVKGVVLDRRINIGQTIIASLNAPSLFLIAKDLRRMQIWASVNETDIGGVHEGQVVHFTVAAFPGQAFQGTVTQIRLNASMVQNVVTYTVVVTVDNPESKLKPYLTARVEFELDRRKGVLLVPNAALRWRPRSANVIPEARAEYVRLTRQTKSEESNRPGAVSSSEGVLWVRAGDFVRPRPVRAGLTDGISSEVQGEGISEGMEVVVGVTVKEEGSEAYSILPHAKSESSKKD